jgi:hypothetical protein
VDAVHGEADTLEHVLSEELEERIDRAFALPTHDPHGDPVPNRTSSGPGRLAAAEEPALERPEQLFAGEVGYGLAVPVLLGDALVVVQAAVRCLKAIGHLVALEKVVVRPRLVARAKVCVDDTPDRPDAARLALDPDCDPLFAADLVHTADGPLGEASPGGVRAHETKGNTIAAMSRLADLFRQSFSFLSARGSRDERIAAYVIREHELGRSLDEILRDRYVQNRLTPQEQNRLLDRPEVIRALGDDLIEDARRANDLRPA